MIAHRIQRTSGKDAFGRLGCYILDIQSPRDPAAFDRLAGYIVDRAGDGERVVGARLTNLDGITDIEDAIAEIEAVQAQNKRSRADKSYHLVVSFPEGERPTAAQLHDIEDQLVEAIGLGEHQRISAIHDDTDNLHVHVAINKVHPGSFRNVEPHYDKRRLMAACRELEIKHGLQFDNHGLPEDRDLARDDEAKRRRHDRADKMEVHGGRESLGSWIETNARGALTDAALTAPDWKTLHDRFAEFGLTVQPRGAGLVVAAVGTKARVKASSIDPALSAKALIARLGPYERPHRQHDAPGPAQGYRAGPRQAKAHSKHLYQRFENERAITQAARTQALANLGQSHADYASRLRRHYQLQRRDVRLDRSLGPALRKKSLDALEVAFKQDRTDRRELAAAQRAALRRDYPLSNWQSFLEREAGRGDETAVAALRSRTTSRSNQGADILTAEDREAARHVVYQQLSPTAAKNGDLTYALSDGGRVTDRAHEVRSDRASPAAAFLALSLASDRFAGQPLQIDGSDAFKASVIQVAALRGFDVQFADPAMERGRMAAVALARGDVRPTRASERGDAAAYVQARNSLRERASDIPHHRLWLDADAGPAEYAGRRAFAGGGEAVLLRTHSEILVLPVTGNQAAKASQWGIGELVVTDGRGRFLSTQRRGVDTSTHRTDELADEMTKAAQKAADRSRER